MQQQQQSQQQLTLFQSVLTNLLESFSHSFCQVISEFDQLTNQNVNTQSNADKKSSKRIMKKMFKSFPRYFSIYRKIISTLSDLAACNPTDIVRFCGKMMKDTLLFSNNTPLNSVQNGLSAGKVNIYDPENKQHQLIFYYFSTFFLSDLIYEIIVQYKAIKANDLLVRVGYTLANSELLIPEIDNMIFDQWAVIYSIVSQNSFQILIDVFPTFTNFLITAQFYKYIRLDMIDRVSESFMNNIFTEIHKLHKKKQLSSEVLEAISNLIIVFPYHEHILTRIFDISYSYRAITENNICNGANILSLTIMLKCPKKKNLLNHFIEKRIFMKAENKESLKNSLKGLRIYMYGRNVKPEWLFWSWGPNPRVDPIEFIQWNSLNELNIKDQQYFHKIFLKFYFQKITYQMDINEIFQFSSIILHLASLNFNSFLETIVPPFLKLDETDDRYIAFIRCVNNINSDSFMKFSCSKVNRSDIQKFNQLVHNKLILSLLSYNDYYSDEQEENESESKNKKKKKKKRKKAKKIDSVAFDVRDVLATEYINENDSQISEILEKWKLNNEFAATMSVLNQTEVLEFDISLYPQLVSILNFIFTDDDFKDQKILSTLIEMSFNHNFLISMTAFNLCKEISKNADYNMSMLNAAVDEMKKRKTPEALFVISTVMFYTLSSIPEPSKIKKKLLLKIESDAFLCICSGYPLVRHLGFHILRKINKIFDNKGLLFIIASNQAQIERSVKADILAHSTRKDISNIFANSEYFHLYNSNRINNLLYSEEVISDPAISTYNQLQFGDENNNNNNENNSKNNDDTETDADEENTNEISESQDPENYMNSDDDSDSSTNFESSTAQVNSDRSSIAMNLNEVSSSESDLFNVIKKKKPSSNLRRVHKLSDILTAKRIKKVNSVAGSLLQKIFHPRRKSLKNTNPNDNNNNMNENEINEEEEDDESQSQTQNQEKELIQSSTRIETRRISSKRIKQLPNSMNTDTSNNIGRLNSIIKFDTCLLSHYYDIWMIFIKHMISLIIDVNYTPLLKNVTYFRENLYDFSSPKTLPSGIGIVLLLLSTQYYLPYLVQFKEIDPEKQFKPFKKHHKKRRHKNRKKREEEKKEDEEEKNKDKEKKEEEKKEKKEEEKKEKKEEEKKEKKEEEKKEKKEEEKKEKKEEEKKDKKEKEKKEENKKDKEKKEEDKKDKDEKKKSKKEKEKEKDKKEDKNKDKKEKDKDKEKDKKDEKDKDKKEENKNQEKTDKEKEKSKKHKKTHHKSHQTDVSESTERDGETETENETTENETTENETTENETETDFYETEYTEYTENEESTLGDENNDKPIEREYVYKDHREEVRNIIKGWLKSNDEFSHYIALMMIKLIHFTLIPTVIDILSEVRIQPNFTDKETEEEEDEENKNETKENENDISLFAQSMHALALHLKSADLSPLFISSQIMPLIQFISNACYTFSKMKLNGPRQVEWTDEKENETAKYSILIQDFCIICETAFNNFFIVNKDKEKNIINDIDKIWPLDNRQVMSRFFMNWLQTKSECLEKVRFYSSHALASIIKLGPIFTGNLLFDKSVGSLFGIIDVMGLNVLKPLLSFHYEQLLNKFIESYFCEPFPVSEHYFRAIIANITEEHSNYSSLLSGPLLFLCLVSSQLENPRSKKLIESFMRTVGPINSVDKQSQDAIIEAMLRSTPQEVIPSYFKYATEAVFAFFFKIVKKKDLKIPIKDIVESITPWLTYVRLLPSQTTCAPDVSTMFAFFTPYQFLVNLMEATESVPPSQFNYMVSIWTELMKTPDHCNLIPAFIVTWGNQKTMRAISLVLFHSHPSKICQKVLPRFSFAFYFYVTVCRKYNQEQKNKQRKISDSNNNHHDSETSSSNNIIITNIYNNNNNNNNENETINTDITKELWMTPIVVPVLKKNWDLVLPRIGHLVHFAFLFRDKLPQLFIMLCDRYNIEYPDPTFDIIHIEDTLLQFIRALKGIKINQKSIAASKTIVENIDQENNTINEEDSYISALELWTDEALKWTLASPNLRYSAMSLFIYMRVNSSQQQQQQQKEKDKKSSKISQVPIPGNLFNNSEMIPVDINLFKAIIRTVAYHIEHFDPEKDEEEDLAFLASESFTFITNHYNMDLNLAFQYCNSFLDCRPFVSSSLVNALPVFRKALDDPDLINFVKSNVISIIRPTIPKLEGSHHLRKKFGEFLTKSKSEEMLTIIVPLKKSNPTFFTEFPSSELIMNKSSTSSLCKALVHYCLMMTTASTSLLNCIFEVSTYIINKVTEENNKYPLVRIYLQALRKISECSKAIEFIKAVSIKQPSVVGTTVINDVYEWTRSLDDVKRNLSKYIVKAMTKEEDTTTTVNRSVSSILVNNNESKFNTDLSKQNNNKKHPSFPSIQHKNDDITMIEISTSSNKNEEEEEEEEDDDHHFTRKKKALSSLDSTSIHPKNFDIPKHNIYSLPKSASIALATQNPSIPSFIRNPSSSVATITDCPNYQSVMKFLDMKDSCPPKILPFESDMDLLENMSKVTRPKTSRKAFVLPKAADQQKGVNISLTKAVISNSMRTSLQAIVSDNQINENDYYNEKEGERLEKTWKPLIHPEKLIFKPEIFNDEKHVDVKFSANISSFYNNMNTANSTS